MRVQRLSKTLNVINYSSSNFTTLDSSVHTKICRLEYCKALSSSDVEVMLTGCGLCSLMLAFYFWCFKDQGYLAEQNVYVSETGDCHT